MKCAITREQQELFLTHVAKDLIFADKSNAEFDPIVHMNNIKDKLSESLKNWEGNQEELVTDYLSELPSVYLMAMSKPKIFSKKFRDVIQSKVSELYNLQEIASNVDTYEEFKNFLFPAVSEEDLKKAQEQNKKEFQQEQEDEAEHKDVPETPETPAEPKFAAKAASPLSTTQRVAVEGIIDDNLLVYDEFLKNFTDAEDLVNFEYETADGKKLKGLNVRVAVIDDAVPLVDRRRAVDDPEFGAKQMVLVFTDTNGYTLYFDQTDKNNTKAYTDVNIPAGSDAKAMYYNLRSIEKDSKGRYKIKEGKTPIQTPEDILQTELGGKKETDEFKKTSPKEYAERLKEIDANQQAQFKDLYDLVVTVNNVSVVKNKKELIDLLKNNKNNLPAELIIKGQTTQRSGVDIVQVEIAGKEYSGFIQFNEYSKIEPDKGFTVKYEASVVKDKETFHNVINIIGKNKKGKEVVIGYIQTTGYFLDELLFVDFLGTSAGYIPVDYNKRIPTTEINWSNSDVSFTVNLADKSTTVAGIAPGNYYIPSPGINILIELDNLSTENIEFIAELLTNKDLKFVDNNGIEVKDPELFKILATYTNIFSPATDFKYYPSSGEIIMGGQKRTSSALLKSDIVQYLTEKKVKYNFTKKNTNSNNNVSIFERVDNDTVRIKKVPTHELIKNNSKVAIVPVQEGNTLIAKSVNRYVQFAPNQELLNVIKNELTEKDNIVAAELSEKTVTSEEVDNTISEGFKEQTEEDEINPDELLRIKFELDTDPVNNAKAKEWIENSPLLQKGINLQVLFNVVNSNAYGSFKNGAITLWQGSDYTVAYHEAWHAFSRHFLTKKEKIELYNYIAKTTEGKKALKEFAENEKINVDELSPLQKYLAIEELIAEDFRQYMMSKGSKIIKGEPKRNTIFRRILNFLKELFTGKNGVNELSKMYDNLRKGNLNNYTPSQQNRIFGKNKILYKFKPTANNTHEFTQTELNTILNTINGYFSEAINEQSAGKVQFFGALAEAPEKFIGRTYNIIKNKLAKQLSDLNQVEDPTPEQLNTIKNLNGILDNWGNNTKGFVNYHLEKTRAIQLDPLALDEEAFRVTEEDQESSRFDVSANDLGANKLASKSTNLLLSMLIDKNKDGSVKRNEYGAPELVSYNKAMGMVKGTIVGKRDLPEMLKALKDLSKEHPWVSDLLYKLSDQNNEVAQNNITLKLRTSFFHSFNLNERNLHQTNINKIQEEDKTTTVEIVGGNVSAVDKIALNEFRSAFRVVENQPFILETDEGNILNINGVLAKYPKAPKTGKEKLEFLHDIGLFLTDAPEAVKELDKTGFGAIPINYIHKALENIKNFNDTTDTPIIIENIIDFLQKDQYGPTVAKKDGTKTNLIIAQAQTGPLKQLADLHVKYSGNYANIALTTADGETQYLHGMRSTLDEQVDALNNVESFTDLIAIPFMSYLKPSKFFMAEGNSFLKALFEYNENTGTYGKKKPGVTLTVDSFTGVQTVNNRQTADYSNSVIAAKADKYTRLGADISNGLLYGKFTTTTHSDKSTVLTYYINDLGVLTGNNDPRHLHINPTSFISSDPNQGAREMLNLLIPYIKGEWTRIKKVKAFNEKNIGNLERIPGVTVPDKSGKLKGAEWQYMSNIFTNDTLEKLENMDTFNVQTLAEQMLIDINTYINTKTRETIKYAEGKFYFDKILVDKIETLAGRNNLTQIELNSAILKGYQANYLFHQLASISLFYGDISEYDMGKHDFLKRNAAIAASGRKFATYKEAMEWANRKRTEPGKLTYAEKMGVDYELTSVLKTGIISDLTLKSTWVTDPNNKNILLDKYKKQIKSAQPEISEELLKQKAEASVDKLINAYSKMDVGDAQGWISFDHYRKLRMLSDRWSVEQDKLYYKIINNSDAVSVEEVTKAFPPDKYQYYGHMDTENYNAVAFHKFSLMPLIPTLIKDTELEVLHDNMVRKGLTYVAHKTASKVSTIVGDTNKVDDYYSFRETNQEKDFEFTPNNIYLEYLKSQLDVNVKPKNSVIFSTQMRKLIIDGRYQDGKPLDARSAKVVEDYEKALEFFIDFRMMELKMELGIDPKDPNAIPDLPKLLNFIQKELSTQDLAEHHIDYIKTDKDGNLAFDLSVGLNADQIEKSLLAIVNNRIVRQKVTGESLVQFSNAMMHKRAATPAEMEKWGTLDLNYYVPNFFKDGSTLAAEVKIAITNGNYKELFNLISPIDNKPVGVYVNVLNKEGDIIGREYNEQQSLARLNQLIQTEEFRNDPEMLKLITLSGVRIPVQGHNSMEYFIVKEFLPAAAGPIIVPPAEIVAKSGSDFDIDKLSMLMPNIRVFGNKVVAISANKNITDMTKVPEMQETLKSKVKELNQQRKDLQQKYADEVEEVYKSKLSPEEFSELNKRKNIFRKNKSKLEAQIAELNTEFSRVISLKNQSQEDIEFLENYTATISELSNKLEAVVNEEAVTLKEFGKNIKDAKLDQLRQGPTATQLIKVNKELLQANIDLAGLSSKAFENELLFSISNMLAMEENFLSLITPNSTDMFTNKEGTGLADEMRKNKKYKPETAVHEDAYTKIKGTTPATNVLEPAYNINTHEQNAVGKDVLGIAAVANTFNVLFNRAGVKLKSSYQISPTVNFQARIKILLQHNSELNEDGQEVVSLSKIYNKDMVKISEILNQLINGFVDVAKDAWVFDVQGNKQLGPVLLFLVQAGVPIQDAVYFLSNPLIQEYVQLTKQSESPYLVDTNLDPKGTILSRFNITSKQWRNEANKYKQSWTRSQLKQMIDIGDTDAKTNVGVFLHFLELTELTNQVTELVQTYNVDTSKQSTLFDVASKENSLGSIGGKTSIFEDGSVQKILRNSPIAPFKKAFDFQKTLWRPLFNFTADPELNRAVIELQGANRKEIMSVFKDTDRFPTAIKRDFLTKMFITELKNLKTLSENNYKGIPITKVQGESPVSITTDSKGNQTIQVNEQLLREQYDNGLFVPVKKTENAYPTNSFQAQGYAPVSALAFSEENGSSFEEFVNFTIERELLRQDLSKNEFQATDLFNDKLKQLKEKQPKSDMELSENYEKRLSDTVYENYLRDKALTKVFNYYQLFINKENNFAKQFYYFKSKYPELSKKYLIINDLIPSSNITKNSKKQQGLLNLILKDNRVTPDVLEAYHANVLELMSPDSKAIANPEGTESIKFANKEIQGLFEMLPALSLIQSGFDVTNLYSFIKAMPQDNLVISISNALKNNSDYSISEFYNEFIRQNNDRSRRARFKNYQSLDATETVSKPTTQAPVSAKIENPLIAAGVKPTDMYGNAAKDIQMAEEATQFIGFQSGTALVSSTDKYRNAWGSLANTGNYTANDVIMVSGSGTFRGVTAEQIRETLTDKYKPLLDKATAAGASFRVGNQYAKGNLSDQLIAEYLQKKGYKEEILDGYSRWTAPAQSSTSVKEGVAELFRSNPELANAVYESLGFENSRQVKIQVPTTLNNYSTTVEVFDENKNKIGVVDIQKRGNNWVTLHPKLTEKGYGESLYSKISEYYTIVESAESKSGQGTKLWEKLRKKDVVDDGIIGSMSPNGDPIIQGVIKEGSFKLSYAITPQQKQQAQQIYSQYLDTIFPDSKVKDIVYRGAEKDIENHRAYSHWTLRKTLADNFAKQGVNLNRKDESNNTVYFALLNVKNLVRTIEITDKSLKGKGFDSAASFPNQQKADGTYYDNEEANESIQLIDKNLNNEITVFEPEQIHILGGKQDIKGFKEFVSTQPAVEPVGEEDFNLTLKDKINILEALTETDLFNAPFIEEVRLTIEDVKNRIKDNPELKKKIANFIAGTPKIQTKEDLENLKKLLCQ